MDIGSFQFSMAALFASVIWGGLGFGMFIYGKKQRSLPALAGGIAMTAVSMLVYNSALWMSLISIAIIVGVYYWSRNE